jgi:hypothetical protein
MPPDSRLGFVATDQCPRVQLGAELFSRRWMCMRAELSHHRTAPVLWATPALHVLLASCGPALWQPL